MPLLAGTCPDRMRELDAVIVHHSLTLRPKCIEDLKLRACCVSSRVCAKLRAFRHVESRQTSNLIELFMLGVVVHDVPAAWQQPLQHQGDISYLRRHPCRCTQPLPRRLTRPQLRKRSARISCRTRCSAVRTLPFIGEKIFPETFELLAVVTASKIELRGRRRLISDLVAGQQASGRFAPQGE